MKENKIIIAGPCSLETQEQLHTIVEFLKNLGIFYVRAPLWKPRTLPGWDGVGAKGLQYLLEETIPMGMIPATEVLCPEHALILVEALKRYNNEAKALVWLGARNQNHSVQVQIAEILKNGSEGIVLMFKNQMWDDEKHWMGIYKHLLSSGFPQERLWMCHRGFSPGRMENAKGYRNLPDFEMAMRMKEACGLPMIIDPSHIAGDRKKVLEVCLAAESYQFNGYIIEIHDDPDKALTDSKQQLNFDEFYKLMKALKITKCGSWLRGDKAPVVNRKKIRF